MAVPTKFRPYVLVGLFLSFCLGAILLSSNYPIAAAPSTDAAVPVSIAAGTRKTVLDNGLTVLTKEVHTAPVVSVQIWYRVGSRNEMPGQNGISHQLEHLMFKGTTDRPIQFGRFFNALGSQSNAFTSYDETAYFGTVESNKLESMLTLEADRMENALVGAEQLDSERKVVISELQGYENRPSYRLDRAVMKTVFPDRAYGLPVGGTKADVEKFTVEQVRSHYQRYYTPDNATLVLMGDFSTEPVLKKVREVFGRLPKRNASEQLPATTSSSKSNPAAAAKPSSPIVLQQPGSAALLQVVYPLPDINHPDVPAIDLMDTVLTGGRSSRLYQALVEKGLASSVGAYAAELFEPGWYSISATAAPGHTPTEMNQVLQQALTQLQQSGISQEELDRAKTQLKTSFVLSNQDISSQASQLAYYQTVAKDYQYVDRYLAAIDRVSATDIQRVAQTYLDPAKQTVGYFEPTQAVDSTGTSASSAGRTAENFSPGKPVDPAEVARYLPNINDSTQGSTQPLPDIFTLSNGLKVLLLPDPSTPIVNLAGWDKAGSSFDTAAKAGLANLTAANLLNGTPTKDALTLAKTLENDGASLSFSALREGTSISGNALTENLPTLIQTLADVMQHAAFPADQLELSRQRALIGLKAELDDPEALSWRVFRQTVYPANHPYSTLPTQESLNRIQQADVIRFYQTYYRPDTTVLALVGNFDSGQVRLLLNQSFGSWKAQGKPPTLSLPAVSLPPSLTQLSRAMTGKAEAVTYLGYYSGISRKDPRYYPALVLNQILGGDTLSSRLGTEVRDRQGLTYGIYSFFQAGVNPGPFAIEMQTAPGDVSKAIDSTLALLKQFREEGVTESELATAKRSIASSYPVNLADPSNVASVILDNEIFGLSPEEIRQFPEHINAVTSDQVKQAIQELIHPGNLVIVTAGPGSSKPVGG